MLCCAALCCAVLCRAALRCAVLCCAVLCCAVLCCAVLCCTVLYCTVLYLTLLYFTLLYFKPVTVFYLNWLRHFLNLLNFFKLKTVSAAWVIPCEGIWKASDRRVLEWQLSMLNSLVVVYKARPTVLHECGFQAVLVKNGVRYQHSCLKVGYRVWKNLWECAVWRKENISLP